MSENASAGVASWPRFALPRGTAVNGYTIERVLGSGGFGVTYLARDDLGQLFAIKEYFPREFAIRQDLAVLAASDEHASLFEDCLNRFRREAQALVRLSRTAGTGGGVVGVVTYFTANGTGYLVMEYVAGTTLAAMLRQQPDGLAAERVSSLLSQLLSSVGGVHQAGLLHRDIKPANIILRDDGRVVLIDFGSSREAGSGQTRTHTQIYSAGYAPLEQMVGQRQGPFSDIYAIGAVCYHAIGGAMMDALTRHHAQSAGQPDPQPSAEQIGSGRYPVPLLKAIDAALTINPEQRPQNVEALRAMLGPVTSPGDTTVAARPSRSSEPPTPPASPTRSRRGRWPIAACAAAVVLTAAAYFVPWHVNDTALRDATRQEATKQDAARQEAAKQASDDAANTCETLAASPYDKTRSAGIDGPMRGRIDTARAIPACERAVADHPTPRLQFLLGRSYASAGKFDDAARLYKLAADQGDALAQLELGGFYNSGRGVAQSSTEAARLYRLAADQGNVLAQQSLGVLYESGRGVEQSWTEAARFYKLAADQGSALAQLHLGVLYESGRGVEQSWTEAARLYKLAADQGFAPAQLSLGVLYESGHGVAQSWTEAARLYKLAADQGNAEAKTRLQTHQP